MSERRSRRSRSDWDCLDYGRCVNCPRIQKSGRTMQKTQLRWLLTARQNPALLGFVICRAMLGPSFGVSQTPPYRNARQLCGLVRNFFTSSSQLETGVSWRTPRPHPAIGHIANNAPGPDRPARPLASRRLECGDSPPRNPASWLSCGGVKKSTKLPQCPQVGANTTSQGVPGLSCEPSPGTRQPGTFPDPSLHWPSLP